MEKNKMNQENSKAANLEIENIKCKISTAIIEKSGNDLLGVEAKKLYYLIIQNENGKKLAINVGEKTFNQANALNEIHK